MRQKEIAIIGGGIAGLTLSIFLKNTSFKCHIFEKNQEFKEIGAAISVFPNALRVLNEAGILSDILSLAGEIKTIYLKTSDGNILSKTEPKYDFPTICMLRSDLQKVLLNHTNAKLYTGYELEKIKNTDDNKVEIIFKNKEIKQFDAVIGADGIHSVVRQYIIGDGKPVFRGYNIWRGIVQTNFEIGYGSETYGKGKRVGIVPVKKGVYGWWATFNEEFQKDDEPEGSKKKLKRLFGNWHFPILQIIADTENIIKNSLVDRKPVRNWTKGKITLLGDAAHPTTPNLGQGGCLAMEGAFLLAKSIQNYGLNIKAFARYEELQFSRAKLINRESLKLGIIGQQENKLSIFLRNLLFKLMPASFALKMVDKYFSYDVTQANV